MKKCILFVLIIIFSSASCAPKEFTPFKPDEIKFEKTSDYDIKQDLENIIKPDPIKPIYARVVNDQIEIVEDRSLATHILLPPQEYAKVAAVVKLSITYKDIILQQEALINQYIAQTNVLKELLEMERQKSLNYRELWVISENMYRQERYDHQVDNFINKSSLLITIVGRVVLIFAGI